MPEAFDPYRPPAADGAASDPRAPVPVADWRPFEAYERGDDLVVSRHAPLADVCMKCGAVEQGLRRRLVTFAWAPSAAFFLVCCGAIGLVILFIAYVKQARFLLPLCPTCDARWRSGTAVMIVGAITLAVGFYAILFSGAAIIEYAGGSVLVAVLTLVPFGIIALVVVHRTVVRPRTVWSGHIDSERVTMRGVHPAARTAAIALSQTYGAAPRR